MKEKFASNWPRMQEWTANFNVYSILCFGEACLAAASCQEHTLQVLTTHLQVPGNGSLLQERHFPTKKIDERGGQFLTFMLTI